MYSWHGPNHHPAANAATSTPGRRLESPNPSPHPSYPMSQLRWPTTMLSRSHNAHPGALPTLSSNLRIDATTAAPPGGGATGPVGGTAGGTTVAGAGPRNNTPQHTPGVSVVVESRVPAESIESSDSDQSDAVSGGRDGADALGDSDYAPTHGDMLREVRDSGRGGEEGAAGATAGGGAMGPAGRISLLDRVLGDEDMESSGIAGDTPRKHGKRLTTLEEVSLFNICNRHAEEFGQRSNLCKWWMTVTAEFTRDQGHPYSWHSVRRKVELVTKQRMKFLEEQREKGGSGNDDLSNPRWRAAVDAWIPTWQRWEEAEARRIEKRDSRRTRKRKERSWEPVWDTPSSNGWRQTSSPAVDTVRGSQSQNQLPPSHPPAVAPATPNPVRLPPGFENMFANQPSSSPGWSSQHANAPSTAPSAGDNGMMSAVLETLGKLNKHLDSVSSEPRPLPLIASLSSNPDSRHHAPPPNQPRLEEVASNESETIEKALSATVIKRLKEELRRELRDELRSELEKDRATLEEKLDSVQRTQDMILEMLRQEPA